jgi:uncharacterized protein
MNCPTCKKPADLSPKNRSRPFCSERCQMIDLGTWAAGDYKIEGSTTSADNEHHDDLKKRRLLN